MPTATTAGSIHEAIDQYLTLDGEPVELADLLNDNRESLTVAQAEEIQALQPGEEMVLGGGAAPVFVLRCEG